MTSRLASLSLASLLLCTACPSDDGDEASSGETGSESGSETATDTETDTGTETEAPACGVGAAVCCMELEECQTTEDCCDPETYTCALEAASTKCIDLVQMCMNCITNCEGAGVPPDVCAMSCAVWCDPP